MLLIIFINSGVINLILFGMAATQNTQGNGWTVGQ
jgi:hypothetical protein